MSKFSPVTHCIFDMDGLLINTNHLYFAADEVVLKKYGKKMTFDVERKISGRKPLEAAKILLEEMDLLDQLSPEEYQKQVDEIYSEVFPKAKLLPGVERLINHLKLHKIPIGISTGSSKEAFELKSQNLKWFFEKFEFILLCGSDQAVKLGKPAPDAFEVARLRFRNIPKASCCLVFEDAHNGVLSARGAGMKVVMVPDDQLSAEFQTEATQVLKSLEEFCPENFGLPPY